MKSMKAAIAIAVSALVNDSMAVSLQQKSGIRPDIFGPNGEGYQNNNTNIDMDQIGIDFKPKDDGEEFEKYGTESSGKKCENGEFAKIQYAGSLEDGRVVTDSLQEFGTNVTIRIGTSETYACIDLAITQLHSGDSVKLTCPAHLVFGKGDQLSPLNGDIVPKNSKVIFDLTVDRCNFEPKKWTGKQGLYAIGSETYQDDQPRTTTMDSGKCMYLHLVESDNTGIDLVLASMEENESPQWPAKRVYFEEKVEDDESQQWKYYPEKGAIRSVANPSFSLASYQGWLWAANVKSKSKKKVEEFPTQVQRFFFDEKKSTLTTIIDGIENEVALWGQPQQWAWAEVASSEELDDAPGSKFRIEYC